MVTCTLCSCLILFPCLTFHFHFLRFMTRREGTLETFGRREQRAANCVVELECQMRFQWLNWHETLEDVLQLCNGIKNFTPLTPSMFSNVHEHVCYTNNACLSLVSLGDVTGFRPDRQAPSPLRRPLKQDRACSSRSTATTILVVARHPTTHHPPLKQTSSFGPTPSPIKSIESATVML
jgi:hypothetical protein